MQISSAFPSEFLRAQDLQGRSVNVVIDRVELRDIGGDPKPVVFFMGKTRGLVLNKTNALELGNYYGNETDAWQGQPVQLYPAKVLYQGRQVDAIRVRVMRQAAVAQQDYAASPQYAAAAPAPAQAAPAAAAALRHEREPGEDEIPF
jgi:hypothetical protein